MRASNVVLLVVQQGAYILWLSLTLLLLDNTAVCVRGFAGSAETAGNASASTPYQLSYPYRILFGPLPGTQPR